MELVAVIVTQQNGLPLQAIENLRANLSAAQEPTWLGRGQACEIGFKSSTMLDRNGRRQLAASLQNALHPEADVGVFENKNRRKKLLVADMDSTMIEQEGLDELAAEIGLKEKVVAITERAMRGEIEFEAALRERVMLLKDLPLARVQAVVDRTTFSPGAKTLVSTMKAHGAISALVSGGFALFTQHAAERLGFDAHFSNRFECNGNMLSGKVAEPIFGAAQKRQALLDLCRQKGIGPQDSLAIGDGANDMPMLEAAGLGIAYRAKPVAAAAADAHIVHGDLTAALYFQGYRQEEFTQ